MLNYTPVKLSIPINFKKKYELQNSLDIKLFICVTMYNENANELLATLRSICQNLKTFRERGVDISKNTVVCIISDGRKKIPQDVIYFMQELGIYDPFLINQNADLHIFEKTIKLRITPTQERCYPPINIMYAIKEINAGKLDSHQWFFNAFCETIQPTYCFLIDVGTIPDNSSIYMLYDAMEGDKNIGGCCGEISVHKPSYLNPIVASQQFEYKMSNILDKSFESIFGFVQVLPGAFSAYRYEAIANDMETSPAPLTKYFMGLTHSAEGLGPFKSNMYLAEDRILCFELIARKNQNWKLKYVKNAVAKTDVPSEIDVLIKQRRRWLNGSLFSFLYAILHMGRYFKNSGHHFVRKFFIFFQFVYFALVFLINWFLVANFYLTFFFIVHITLTGNVFNVFALLRYLFLFLTLLQFILGLGNSPHKMKNIYALSSLFYGFIMCVILTLTVNHLLYDDIDFKIIIAVMFSVGVYFIASLLHGFKNFTFILFTFVQYTFMLPTYVFILPIYSFCNIHDISWGTKGISTNNDLKKVDERHDSEKKLLILIDKDPDTIRERKIELEDKFKAYRSHVLLAWISTNGLFISVVTLFDISSLYLELLFLTIFFFNGIRFLGSIIFLIQNHRSNRSSLSRHNDETVRKVKFNESDNKIIDGVEMADQSIETFCKDIIYGIVDDRGFP